MQEAELRNYVRSYGEYGFTITVPRVSKSLSYTPAICHPARESLFAIVDALIRRESAARA